MSYFVPEGTQPSVNLMRESADVFDSTRTINFTQDGTFYLRMDAPKIGEKLALLSDVTLVKAADTGIIQNVTQVDNLIVYQVYSYKDPITKQIEYSLTQKSTFGNGIDEILGQKYPTYQNNSSYVTATVTAGSSTEGYLNEFYVAVTGGVGIFDATYGQFGLDAPNDGRALLTRGEITGQRDAAWGSWLDTVSLDGVGYPEPTPVPDYVFDLPSDFAFSSAPGVSQSTLYDLDVYGAWRALHLNLDPAIKGVAGTTAEQLWDQLGSLAVDAVASRLGSYGESFRKMVDLVKSSNDLRGRMADSQGNFFEQAFSGFDAASGKNGMSPKEFDATFGNNMDHFRSSLREWTVDKYGVLGGLIFDAFADRPFGVSEVNSFRALTFDKGALITGGDKQDSLVGSSGNDTFRLSPGGDAVFGYDGNDVFVVDAPFGQALISGGRGFDKVIVAGDGHSVSSSGGVATLSGAYGTASIVGVERIEMTSGIFATDTGSGENAGNAYRIYKAAFDRDPDAQGLAFWTKWLDDGKTDPWNMAARFIDSREFEELYGSRHPGNEDYLLRVYRNVLDRDPDQGGYDWWLSKLADGTFSQSEVLARFSDSLENRDNVSPKIGDGVFLSNEYFQF